jgi:hypothetical protein
MTSSGFDPRTEKVDLPIWHFGVYSARKLAVFAYFEHIPSSLTASSFSLSRRSQLRHFALLSECCRSEVAVTFTIISVHHKETSTKYALYCKTVHNFLQFIRRRGGKKIKKKKDDFTLYKQFTKLICS